MHVLQRFVKRAWGARPPKRYYKLLGVGGQTPKRYYKLLGVGLPMLLERHPPPPSELRASCTLDQVLREMGSASDRATPVDSLVRASLQRA